MNPECEPAISVEALQLAVEALANALDDYRFAQENQPRLVLSVRDGAIQRFEVAMDLSRKLILRVLQEKFGADNTTANNKTFIREGAKFGLIVDAEAWMGYLSSRNRTSHIYDAVIANQVFTCVPAFLADARNLLERLRHVIA